MKGFALILAFLAVEAAFLWSAAAPRAATPALAPAPAFARGVLQGHPAPSAAPDRDGARCQTRTFVVETRCAGPLPGVVSL